MTLKVKYADFQQITRSRTCQSPFAEQEAIEATVHALAGSLLPVAKGIRLLGVTLSSLRWESGGGQQQLPLSI